MSGFFQHVTIYEGMLYVSLELNHTTALLLEATNVWKENILYEKLEACLFISEM
jgi:hypothetical protein